MKSLLDPTFFEFVMFAAFLALIVGIIIARAVGRELRSRRPRTDYDDQ